MATNYSTLVDSVRRRVNFPAPVSGGADKLSNPAIIEYLNDAFEELTEIIRGVAKYVEFTITSAGAITVTKPASNAPTVAAMSPEKDSYTLYQVSDAYSYNFDGFENLTPPILDNSYQRQLWPLNLHNSLFQTYFLQGAVNYFTNVGVQPLGGSSGFALLPPNINQTNTVGIRYRGEFTRYEVTDIEQSTGTGLSDLSLSGIYTKSDGSATDYAIKITTEDAQDQFKLSTDGGATYPGADINCLTTGNDIGNGFTLTWGAITGHTLNDEWEWTATAPSLDEFESDRDMRRYPVYSAGADVTLDIDDVKFANLDGLALRALARVRTKHIFKASENLQSWEYPSNPTPILYSGYFS